MYHIKSHWGCWLWPVSNLGVTAIVLAMFELLVPANWNAQLVSATPMPAIDSVPSSSSPPEPPVPAPSMSQFPVQLDPLDSPYPIPWNWVLATQSEVNATSSPKLRYYRTQALISPDGHYATYSRIQMRAVPEFTQSRVSSVMFVEDLRTGDLQTIVAASPFADHPLIPNIEPTQSGQIAILIPIAWSAQSDRILAREFESIFGTDLASDFAVVWDRTSNYVQTVAPTGFQYSNAVLLGWSQTRPNQVLFRAGNLGDLEWNTWSVDFSGQTIAANEDQPISYGQRVTNVWAGPQAYR